MNLLSNTGNERVIDLVRPRLVQGAQLEMVTSGLSLFAFAELSAGLSRLAKCRLVLPRDNQDLALLGSSSDRPARNRLQQHWLAERCARWLSEKVDLRLAPTAIPQGTLVLRDAEGLAHQAVLGSFAFTTGGLGMTPGNSLSLIEAAETAEESQFLSSWFDAQWSSLEPDPDARRQAIAPLDALATHRDPSGIYALLMACLDTSIPEDAVEPRARGIVDWHRELAPVGDSTVVFRDSAFGNDVAKTNLAAILQQHGLQNVRSL